jgi:hypothetical protein
MPVMDLNWGRLNWGLLGKKPGKFCRANLESSANAFFVKMTQIFSKILFFKKDFFHNTAFF